MQPYPFIGASRRDTGIILQLDVRFLGRPNWAIDITTVLSRCFPGVAVRPHNGNGVVLFHGDYPGDLSGLSAIGFNGIIGKLVKELPA